MLRFRRSSFLCRLYYELTIQVIVKIGKVGHCAAVTSRDLRRGHGGAPERAHRMFAKSRLKVMVIEGDRLSFP
jgi:hypothetical protein